MLDAWTPRYVADEIVALSARSSNDPVFWVEAMELAAVDDALNVADVGGDVDQVGGDTSAVLSTTDLMQVLITFMALCCVWDPKTFSGVAGK